MTPQEVAHEIAIIPIEDIDAVINLAFDEVEATGPASRVQAFYEACLAAGVDLKPICKRKHPA
jgi:predicted ATP-dependent protease